jgi:hypothetical protein
MPRSSQGDFTDGQPEPIGRDPYDRDYGPVRMDDDYDVRRPSRSPNSGQTIVLVAAVVATFIALAIGVFLGFMRTASGPTTLSGAVKGSRAVGGNPGQGPMAVPVDGPDGPAVGMKLPVPAGTAVITGSVKFEGDLPDLTLPLSAKEKFEKSPDDKDHCLHMKASNYEKGNPAWKINMENRGVEYVVVFLKPEGGTFFAVSPDDKAYKAKTAKNPEVSQPFCAFIPNTVVVFSKYRDKDAKVKSTNQALVIKNDSHTAGVDKGIVHNTRVSRPDGQVEADQAIAPGNQFGVKDLASAYKPYTLSCSIHPWMSGSVWVLDHPYFDVTDKDGNFTIENAPAGKVRLIVWHNANGVINGGGKGEVIELKDGDTVKKDFKITK